MPYIIGGIIALFVIILFVAAAKIMDMAGISARCEGNENLKYFKAKSFDNLNARPISFQSDKSQTLNGFLYSNAKIEKYKALIVFSHGMGAGHLAYTTEINYFCLENNKNHLSFLIFPEKLSKTTKLSNSMTEEDFFFLLSVILSYI